MSKPSDNPVIQFSQAMKASGLDVAHVIDDGKIHKCKCSHDKGSKTSGRYYLHSDGAANGQFGCYHDHDNALGCEWASEYTDTRTEAQKAVARAQYAIQAAAREAQLLSEQAETAAQCVELWGKGHDATTHDYLSTKSVHSFGLKVLNGALLVPLHDGKPTPDNLVNIQFIQADGTKRFKTGGKKQGCYFSFGSSDYKTVVVCEGYSTAASIAQSTGFRVIVAFDAGNLMPVAQRIASTLPDGWRMVIAADNDAHGSSNTGVIKATATAQAVGAFLAVPCFDDLDVTGKPTDFNDLMALAGKAAVNGQFEACLMGEVLGVVEAENLLKPVVGDVAGQAPKGASGIPKSFTVNDRGVWFTDDKGESMRVCDRLDVVAMTRNGSSEAWGRLLRWHDADNSPHQWAMPIELSYGVSADVSKELARQGLIISPSNRAALKLNDYIVGCQPKTRARCINKTGWYLDSFVLPTETIGGGNEIAIYQTSDGMSNPYTTSGTIEDWRDNVAALCVGNSRCVLAVSMAFAGVLLPLAGIEGGGVHIVGSSSTGKSTASRLSASVYGDDKFMRQWRVTDNGLEGIASMHNHGILILDELRQAPAKDVGSIVYMLANGAGKVRASRSGGGKQGKSWELLYLSNGEIGLSQHMGEAGKAIHAGQETRFVEIRADAGAGFGLWALLQI